MLLYLLAGSAVFGEAILSSSQRSGRYSESATPSRDLTERPLEDLTGLGLSTPPKGLEVSTPAKYLQRRSTAPSNLHVVTAEDIRTYGYRTLGEILRSLPGTYLTDDRNYSYLGVRGFQRSGDYNQRVLVLVDGVRINNNIYDESGMGNDFVLDTDLIERVEFAPGPGSAIYGNNAFFGVVNIATRRGHSLNAAEVSGEYGGFDTYKIRGSYGRRFDNGVDVLLSATGFDREGPRQLHFPEFDTPAQNGGKAEGLDYDRNHSAFAKLGRGPWQLEGGYVYRVKGLAAAPFGIRFNDPLGRSVDQHAFVGFRFEDRIAPAWELLFQTNYQRAFYRGDYPKSHPAPGEAPLNVDIDRGEWWGGEIRAVNSSLDRHRLLLGAEWQHNLQQLQRNFDVGGASYLDKPYRSLRYGFFLQDEFRLLDSLTLTVGARYDYNPLGSSANPRAALIWLPRGDTTVKLLYGSAFRAPNVYERFYTDGGVTYKASPGVKPEDIDTTEIVLEHFLTPSTRLSASLYHYDMSNLIELRQSRTDGLLYYDNLNRGEGQGMELEAERRWNNGTQATLGYSLQRAGDHRHDPLTNSPTHLLKLHLGVPLWSEHWRAGLETLYMSSRKSRMGEVDGHVLANLTVSGEWSKNLLFSFGVYNGLNAHYADPVGDDWKQNQLDRDGRSFRLKLNLRF